MALDLREQRPSLSPLFLCPLRSILTPKAWWKISVRMRDIAFIARENKTEKLVDGLFSPPPLFFSRGEGGWSKMPVKQGFPLQDFGDNCNCIVSGWERGNATLSWIVEAACSIKFFKLFPGFHISNLFLPLFHTCVLYCGSFKRPSRRRRNGSPILSSLDKERTKRGKLFLLLFALSLAAEPS